MSKAKPQTYTKSDSQIQQEVLQELAWDSRVEQTKVGVVVNHGVVVLSGIVSNYAQRVAAQEAAHRVTGVLDVVNDLKVKIPSGLERTDVDIAQAIRLALEWNVWVDERRILSTVSNGWVTLEGTVDLLRERDDAERAVRRLAGVRGVTNRIDVAGSTLSADRLRTMIEGALERRAEREAHGIKVEVNDRGAVTLTGRVRSWADKRAILGAVIHTPGVRTVNENLFVAPFL